MTSSALSLMSQADVSLRSLGFDLKQYFQSFDLQTVGVVVLVAALGLFLFNLLSYAYATYTGRSDGFRPYGRSLITGAARAWQDKDHWGINDVRGGRGLDEVAGILDALSNAVLEWEEPSNALRNRAL
ncbi:unnamed protein product [Meganyctiphanes norvegica]|uniref:Uncharacterized protein n=1 Tax=Meganyctiphanes norvegica TaxID=48144 RepID=A0AAV2RSV8_MEGNR